jgi:hypothetical protein
MRKSNFFQKRKAENVGWVLQQLLIETFCPPERILQFRGIVAYCVAERILLFRGILPFCLS